MGVVMLLGRRRREADPGRNSDSRPCDGTPVPPSGTFWLMRAVFSAWLIVIAVGLAYMLTIALLGR
jgi:hypothetical protein